jgi:hypothetical protein
MIRMRRATERGRGEHGWLHSWHSFSFADYVDPKHMGHSVLRVINDDTVEAGGGFGTHPHRDMEIISWVLEGELEHRDSMGHGSVIRPGEIQRMSAGTGVTHSEFNPSERERTHFLQIWILPDRAGHTPGYAQTTFADGELRGGLRLATSPDGRDGSVAIHQDAYLYIGRLDAGDAVSHTLAKGRRGYVHLAKGSLHFNGQAMQAGDGAYIEDEPTLAFTEAADAEVLVFDLP